jgi:gluconolactonase
MRCAIHGNLWAAASDGIHCHAPDSTLIGKMRIPETCAYLVFGGLKVNRLYICATKSLYAVYLNTLGITPWDASRAEWATS